MQVLTLSDLHRSELIGKGFDSNLKYQLIYKFPFAVRCFKIPISSEFLHILNEPDFSEDIESKSRDSSAFWKSDCGWFFSKKSPAVSLEWQVAFLTLAMKPESMPQFIIISTHEG